MPGEQPDQIVLVVDVVEKSTGDFSIGAGYTTGGESSGVNLEIGITERNFLGRGQFLKVAAGGSTNSRTYNLSFTEPYFLGYRVAAGFDVFKNATSYDAYTVDRNGATVRFGLPITDQLSAQVAYNLVQDDYLQKDTNGDGIVGDLDTDGAGPDTGDAAIPGYIPAGQWMKSSLSYSLVFNNIDDMNNPHSGLYAKFYQEFAGLGGDAKWLKSTFKATYYQTLSEEFNWIGLISAGGGYIYTFEDDAPAVAANGILVGDQFKASNDIVRGFAYNGFGPMIGADHVGGTTYFNASAEVQFPLPAVPESIGLKGALFADAGTLFGSPFTDATNTGMAWRASVGASLIWASTFGPLRVDYAMPVAKESTDKIQSLNFGIATKF